jgi:hypothetical protein
MKSDEHRLYLTFHHIIFDGVSISRIFVPELTAAYEALEQKRPLLLPTPQLHYGDYAIWRERHVESPVVKQHLAWWTEQLEGELPILRLPEDRPRPAVASHRGSMECFDIPPELLQNLRKLSRARGATLYMSLLAAYKVLLFRYSAQNDLIVGSATDARRRPNSKASWDTSSTHSWLERGRLRKLLSRSICLRHERLCLGVWPPRMSRLIA